MKLYALTPLVQQPPQRSHRRQRLQCPRRSRAMFPGVAVGRGIAGTNRKFGIDAVYGLISGA